jgi:dCMP deaminase
MYNGTFAVTSSTQNANFADWRLTVDDRQLKWDLRFMRMADLVAENSKDRSAKVGCVVFDDQMAVLSTGYNGFPRLVSDDVEGRHERPAKYRFTVHAEANSIANAARRGISLQGATLAVNWFPCAPCAGLLIQAGVREIVAYRPEPDHPRWGADHLAALEMFAEAGVLLRILEGERIKS